MYKTLFVLAVALFIAGAVIFTISVADAQEETKPNIVYIVTDDMAKSDLEEMPYTKSLIFDQGITYENFMVATSLCCPSRAETLTGKYAHNTGVADNLGNNGGVEAYNSNNNAAKSYATWTKQQGYENAMFGKYLNGYSCSQRVPPGFDMWKVKKDNHMYGYCLNVNGREVDFNGEYYQDLQNEQVTNWISNQTAPFTAYVSPKAPHSPATPAKRHIGEYNGQQAPRSASFNEDDVSDKPAWVQNKPKLNQDAQDRMDRDWRDRMESLQAVDETVRDVYNTLQAEGKLENTYIIFTSDNGWHYGHHRISAGKRSYYEPSINLPLGIRGPGIPAGRVTNQLVSNIDFAPTFAELSGATPNTEVDGRSIVPTFASDAPNWRKRSMHELLDDSDGKGIPGHHALRMEDSKYVRLRESGFEEYYDLTNDPDEMENISGTIDLAEERQLLEAMKTCSGQECRDLEDQ